jgi:hypothetical protein
MSAFLCPLNLINNQIQGIYAALVLSKSLGRYTVKVARSLQILREMPHKVGVLNKLTD